MSFLLVIGQARSVLLVPFSAVLTKVPQSLFLRVTIHYNNHLLILYSKRFCNEQESWGWATLSFGATQITTVHLNNPVSF